MAPFYLHILVSLECIFPFDDGENVLHLHRWFTFCNAKTHKLNIHRYDIALDEQKTNTDAIIAIHLQTLNLIWLEHCLDFSSLLMITTAFILSSQRLLLHLL